MPRKPRPLERDIGVVKDASLIIIASEDTHAVQAYFAKFRPRRVQFKVLPTENGCSSPRHIVDRLDQFRDEFFLKEDDQLWYCGDMDHWAQENHLPNLLQVLKHCDDKGYYIAISKPCFELWLLLHFVEFPKDLETCADVCNALSKVSGGYSKQHGCKEKITAEMVHSAVKRAVQLDSGTADIPATPTTRIYRIFNLLIDRESIVIKHLP